MNIGPSFIGTGVALVILAAVNIVVPEPAFIAVKNISYADGYVTFTRTIRPPNTVADWDVVMVEDGREEPICEGGGWAPYTHEESIEKVWPIDAFVGETGCGVRIAHGLANGKSYTGFASWIPRDGRRPVLEQFRITGDE